MYDLNHNHKYTGSLYLRITLFSLMNSGKTSCPSPLLLTQSQYSKDIYSRNCFSPHSMPAGSLSRSYYNSYNGNQHQHHHRHQHPNPNPSMIYNSYPPREAQSDRIPCAETSFCYSLPNYSISPVTYNMPR